MYRGFQLKFQEDPFESSEYQRGLAGHTITRKSIEATLESYLDVHGVLDASKMEADWFPQVQADIFISHAHKDEQVALGLAGWLHKTFGLKSFVDSGVWGYAGVLQKRIDKEYCYDPETRTYDYTQRNYSTGHVHMMLATALTRMIDNCECLFFLNTPAAITIKQAVQDAGKTLSPWIYHELAVSQMLRQKKTRVHRFNDLRKAYNEGVERRDLQMAHSVSLAHLNELTPEDLEAWEGACDRQTGVDSLDVLYETISPVVIN